MTCNLPFYKERREAHKNTFDFFKENGFILVYLFGNAPNYEIKLEEIGQNEYNLFVPVIECYEMLSPKMEYAFNFLYKNGCSGIIKLDDDVQLLDKDTAEYLILYLFSTYDYAGLGSGNFGGRIEKVHISKYTFNFFKNLYVKCDLPYCKYFGGPFYWLSRKALEQVCKTGLVYFYEDVSVGYAVSSNKELTVATNTEQYFKTVFTWGIHTGGS